MSEIELRFLSERLFVESLEDALSGQSSVNVQKSQVVSDPTDLNLDLGTVSAVVATMSSLFFEGPIVPTLARVLRRTTPRKVRIESPFGTVTFEPSSDVSDVEIRAWLKRLVAGL